MTASSDSRGFGRCSKTIIDTNISYCCCEDSKLVKTRRVADDVA